MFPHDRIRPIWNFVHNAFQFDGASFFVEFLRRRNASIIVNRYVWHYKDLRIEKYVKRKKGYIIFLLLKYAARR